MPLGRRQGSRNFLLNNCSCALLQGAGILLQVQGLLLPPATIWALVVGVGSSLPAFPCLALHNAS